MFEHDDGDFVGGHDVVVVVVFVTRAIALANMPFPTCSIQSYLASLPSSR